MPMSRNKSSFDWSPPKVNKNNDIWHSLISKYASRTEVAQTGRNLATKENIIYFAKQAENAGFTSLWVLERLIWPITPQDKYPGTIDGKFPEDWQYIFDPLETLTFATANTSKIALGTSVIDMLYFIIL